MSSEYKGHLAACDLPRRNDLDGRGNLSEENLAEFTNFFLTVCLDQVNFMEGLMQPDQLRTRILLGPKKKSASTSCRPNPATSSKRCSIAANSRAAMPPPSSARANARPAASSPRLIDQGVVTSESTRAPLRLAFPAALASRWMPGLFPEKVA